MGSAVHRLASHAKHLKAVLNMKAFVATLAALAASAKGQVLPFYPYAGVPVVAGPAPVAPAAIVPKSNYHAHGYSVSHYGNAYPQVSGVHSFRDANGVLQNEQYVSDGLGYRVPAP